MPFHLYHITFITVVAGNTAMFGGLLTSYSMLFISIDHGYHF